MPPGPSCPQCGHHVRLLLGEQTFKYNWTIGNKFLLLLLWQLIVACCLLNYHYYPLISHSLLRLMSLFSVETESPKDYLIAEFYTWRFIKPERLSTGRPPALTALGYLRSFISNWNSVMFTHLPGLIFQLARTRPPCQCHMHCCCCYYYCIPCAPSGLK